MMILILWDLVQYFPDLNGLLLSSFTCTTTSSKTIYQNGWTTTKSEDDISHIISKYY